MRSLDRNWSSSCKCEANSKLRTAFRFDLISFDFNFVLKQSTKLRSKRPPDTKMRIYLPNYDISVVTYDKSYDYDEPATFDATWIETYGKSYEYDEPLTFNIT